MIQAPEEHGLQVHFKGDRLPSGGDFAEEREALERVLQHQEISRSTSLVRFLRFICEMYFENRSEDIREHNIAVKALGRKESTFDSQVDPIVRVTARALRKRLRDYYDHEGKDDPVEIVIPLGRYIPQFVRHEDERLLPTPVETLPGKTCPPEQTAPHPIATSEAFIESHAIVADETAAAPSPADRSQRPAGRSLSIWWMVAVAAIVLPGIFYAGVVLGKNYYARPTPTADAISWGNPVWSDEFNGSQNQAPDASKWTYDVGSQNSWGNHELETYCAPASAAAKGCDPRHPNAFLDGSGHLVLRAQKNADGNWSSARITTRGLKNFQYGRIEARMKLPVGTGLWPAFWLLGADFDKEGWPSAGTMDIVENVGLTSRSNGLGPSTIRASLHAPGFSGGNSLRRNFKFQNGERVDDGFHTYGIIWSPGMVQYYVDDPSNIFFVQNASDMPEGGQWVFDRPFYLVMNLAVGGDWSGDPDNTTSSPADILVDYVRVYDIPATAPRIEWHPVDVTSGSMASSTVVLHGQKGMGRVYLSCSTKPETAACGLDASTVNFSDSNHQQDIVTVYTETSNHGTRMVAPPGKYKLTIVATSMSGDRTSVTEEFQVDPPGKP